MKHISVCTSTLGNIYMTSSAIATLPFAALRPTKSDRDRFAVLVNNYSKDLYRYAYWLCHDQGMAEDLVQETFLRAWRAAKSLRDPRATKAWLLTILRREHARQFERYRPKFEEIEADALPCQNNHDLRTEAFILRRAISTLPLEYREPLLLQVLGGYSTAEIADMLGLSRGAVMTRVFRAKQKLRRRLGGSPEGRI